MTCMPINISILETSECVEDMTYISAVKNELVLDSQYETLYEAVNKLAAMVCDTPVAKLTLINDKADYLGSKIKPKGIPEAPVKAFWELLDTKDRYLEVLDSAVEMHYIDHPFKAEIPDFMFYAGVTITLPMGE